MFSNDQRKTFIDSHNDGFCAMLVYCMLYKVLQSYDRCTMRHSQYIQNNFYPGMHRADSSHCYLRLYLSH